MSSPAKRRNVDVLKLKMSNRKVNPAGDDMADLYVEFRGPPQSPYEGGRWKVHVILPVQYPIKSPSIGFCNKIFHPNIDFASGTVCLDVINQTWSPMYSLVNIFEIFLPQLLQDPNTSDPLNSEAATLCLKNKEAYHEKVKAEVRNHAGPNISLFDDDNEDDDDDLSDISDADDDDLDDDFLDVNEETAASMEFF